MEHGRKIFTDNDDFKLEKNKTFKERLREGRDWVSDHKGQVVVVGLSTAALTTYITYQIFEGKSYDGFGDSNS